MGRKNHASTKPQGHKTAKKAVNVRVVKSQNDKPHLRVGESVDAYNERLAQWHANKQVA
jgi:hypothetical protein